MGFLSTLFGGVKQGFLSALSGRRGEQGFLPSEAAPAVGQLLLAIAVAGIHCAGRAVKAGESPTGRRFSMFKELKGFSYLTTKNNDLRPDTKLLLSVTSLTHSKL